ncbi:MAG: hydroxymethylglutaryl-CoA reductase, degradative [Polyangia bacterium]|nr:hydroxymethylglutaryl-CoA reductase, degradative [Polyangia bacterium]
MQETIPIHSSRIPGFYKMTVEARLEALTSAAALTMEDACLLGGTQGTSLSVEVADRMVENCVGVFGLPIGIGVNLLVNGMDRLVPMAVEEPSIIAGFSHGAKLLRDGGGISTESTEPLMIGQIQVLDVPDLEAAMEAIEAFRHNLLADANSLDPALVRAGGGARDIELRVLEPTEPDDPLGAMLVLHLVVDVRDAMGANAINTMAEKLAPRIESLTGGRVRLRILSNLADKRLTTARGKVPFASLGQGDGPRGREVALGIQEASVLAERDPYRAATHNKGIMNGVDAFLVATGQDWRAVEAGAHSFAARKGRYTALARWRAHEDDEALEGEITLPMAVGTVGGVLKTHPSVQVAVRSLLKLQSASELASLAASVGLAQNLAALRALSTEGIQRGHMGLHARNVAAAAGARGDEVDALAKELARQGAYDAASAEALLAELRRSAPAAPSAMLRSA